VLFNISFEKFWLILIASAVLIPRELNIRFREISFSITDVFFIILILAGILLILKNRTIRNFKINILCGLPIIVIFVAAILDTVLKGVEIWYIFVRDIYTFSILPLTFFVVFNSLKTDARRYIFLILVLLTLLSLWAIAVVNFPPLSKWYVEVGRGIELFGGELGYVMPSHGNVGPLLDVGRVRPSILMGGSGHLGWLSLLAIPIFFEHFKLLSKRFGIFFTAASIIIIVFSLLCLMSKAVILGLIVSLAVWLKFSYSPIKLKVTCISLICLSTLLFGGDVTLLSNRFHEIKYLEKEPVRWPTSSEIRLKLYREAVDYIIRNPILGIGMGNRIKVTMTFIDQKIEDRYDGVDSFYLTVLLKLGILGIIFPLLFFYFIYRIYLYINGRKGEVNSIAVGTFSSLSGVLFTGLFGYFFHSPSFNMILGTVFALAAREIFSKRDE
jgi:hypothetical protein